MGKLSEFRRDDCEGHVVLVEQRIMIDSFSVDLGGRLQLS